MKIIAYDLKGVKISCDHDACLTVFVCLCGCPAQSHVRVGVLLQVAGLCLRIGRCVNLPPIIVGGLYLCIGVTVGVVPPVSG